MQNLTVFKLFDLTCVTFSAFWSCDCFASGSTSELLFVTYRFRKIVFIFCCEQWMFVKEAFFKDIKPAGCQDFFVQNKISLLQ